jgi:hypothetical protein
MKEEGLWEIASPSGFVAAMVTETNCRYSFSHAQTLPSHAE